MVIDIELASHKLRHFPIEILQEMVSVFTDKCVFALRTVFV